MLKTMATKNISFWQLSFVGVAILILLILASGTANADATAVDITGITSPTLPDGDKVGEDYTISIDVTGTGVWTLTVTITDPDGNTANHIYNGNGNETALTPIYPGDFTKVTAQPSTYAVGTFSISAVAGTGSDTDSFTTSTHAIYGNPHLGTFSTTADECAGCHRAHTAQLGKLLKSGNNIAEFCYSCHENGVGAYTDVTNGVYYGTVAGTINAGLKGGGFKHAKMDPGLTGTAEIASVTSAHTVTDSTTNTGMMWGAGPIVGAPGSDQGDPLALGCTDCHNPHGNGKYRILRPYPIGMPSDDPSPSAVDVADNPAITYTANYYGNNYKDADYAPDNLGEWCAQCHTRYDAGSGDGHTDSGDHIFAYRHNTSGTFLGCTRCHVAHGTSSTMGDYSGAVPWPGGSDPYNDPDPTSNARSSLLHSNNRGVCAQCHVDITGEVYMHGTPGGGGGGGGDCGGCHGKGHTIHITSNSKGPATPMDCIDCHDSNNYSLFTDGENLDDTGVCDPCHSPAGSYNGVDSVGDSVGAKDNWADGVYGSPLKAGKEKWCVGCHDENPAIISGISAPDVKLFWTSGHGRAATVDCENCHDVSAGIHIDGNARTYSFSNEDTDENSIVDMYEPDYSGVAYQAGYRLGDVGGGVPLMIPANYGNTFGYNAATMRDNSFRLCFDCHDMNNIFDDTAGDDIDSNFKASLPNPPRDYSYAWGSGADVNEHVSHIMNYVSAAWDSDWDTSTTGAGGSNGTDSLTACSSCHNVHGALGAEGSTNEVMIRDGSLAGRAGYGFSYVIEDGAGYPMVTSTGATQSTSVGAIFRNNTDNMCGGSMCHGDPSPPASSTYDAIGNGWGTYIEYYRPWQDTGHVLP